MFRSSAGWWADTTCYSVARQEWNCKSNFQKNKQNLVVWPNAAGCIEDRIDCQLENVPTANGDLRMATWEWPRGIFTPGIPWSAFLRPPSSLSGLTQISSLWSTPVEFLDIATAHLCLSVRFVGMASPPVQCSNTGLKIVAMSENSTDMLQSEDIWLTLSVDVRIALSKSPFDLKLSLLFQRRRLFVSHQSKWRHHFLHSFHHPSL